MGADRPLPFRLTLGHLFSRSRHPILSLFRQNTLRVGVRGHVSTPARPNGWTGANHR